jgi:phosphoribosylaminoimidazole-succinocarboxamide synthase
MNKGYEIARGKTKVLFEAPGKPEFVVVQQTDDITAGDGARHSTIPGKGRLAAQTTARVFRLLNLCGLPTHYVNGGEDDDHNEMLVRRCNMIPLEVVVRGVAAGSLVKRNPGLQKGAVLVPRMIEFFVKDDANHDPQIGPDQIVTRGIAAPPEIATMSELARLTFEILAHAWRKRDVLLVDLKIEFGRVAGGENNGQLIIADVIDNDSWRLWPQGREELMLDKQVYRNLETVDEAALARVKTAYEQVADMVGSFPTMRPGMVAIISDGPEHVERANKILNEVGQFGIPISRHVASATRTPGYVTQLVTQLEATFARLIFIAVDGDGVLAKTLEYATPAPVIAATAPSAANDAQAVALRCAKVLGAEDTVLFGRTLLVQGNARSAILQADAQLQVPPPNMQPGNPPPGTSLG